MADEPLVRILATGDLHLGMRFAKYPDVAERLSQARYEVLERIVWLADERQCDLIIIAGDLFDRVNLARKDVLKALEILQKFQGKGICVLPGNHDHFVGRGSSLWSIFNEYAGGLILFLGEKKPYSLRHLDLDVLLLPGPCESKHSALHALAWIEQTEIPRDHELIVGIGHGSVEGVSPDFEDQYYPMTLDLFDRLPPSLWIVGHTHLAQEHRLKSGTVVFPGTPEPDGFDYTRQGMVSSVEVKGGKPPAAAVERIESGAHIFKRVVLDIAGPEDLAAAAGETETEESKRTLLKLALNGRVAAETFEEVQKLRKRLEKTFLYSELDDSGLSLEITREMIEREFSRGSFPYLLLSELLEKEDTEALHTAYDLLMEARV